MKVDVQWRSLALGGAPANGDGVWVRENDDQATIGVIDGLGHGPRAQEVTEHAMEILDDLGPDWTVHGTMEELDRRLRGSRGLAILLCRVGPGRLTICSVGNVMLKAEPLISLPLTPGIIGRGLRRPKVIDFDWTGPQRMVFFTDGVSSRFGLEEVDGIEADQACDTLFERHRREHDDATLVLVDLED